MYTVTFLDWDSKVLGEQKVAYGQAAAAPEIPTHEGYKFTGWDKAFDNITEDLTVTAQFVKIPTYVVTVSTPWHAKIIFTNAESLDLNAVPENTVLHLEAEVDKDYKLVSWWDGEKSLKRDHTVTEDVEISLTVTETDGIEQVTAPTGADKIMRNGNIYILRDGKMYNLLGGEVNL
jgi:hypothetical protein